jgi:hypothetical protein
VSCDRFLATWSRLADRSGTACDPSFLSVEGARVFQALASITHHPKGCVREAFRYQFGSLDEEVLETRRFLIAAEQVEDEAVDRLLGGFSAPHGIRGFEVPAPPLDPVPKVMVGLSISVLWENIWSWLWTIFALCNPAGPVRSTPDSAITR